MSRNKPRTAEQRQRIRVGIALARKRGVRLGNPRPESLKAAQRAGGAVARARARKFAAMLAPIIRDVMAHGLSLRQTVEWLNADWNPNPTPSGRGKWHVSTVRRVLSRT